MSDIEKQHLLSQYSGGEDEMAMGEEMAADMEEKKDEPKAPEEPAKAEDKKSGGMGMGAAGDMAKKMNPMAMFGSDEETASDRTVTPWGRMPTYEECCCCFCHCSD
jgi:hypothetical protein